MARVNVRYFTRADFRELKGLISSGAFVSNRPLPDHRKLLDGVRYPITLAFLHGDGDFMRCTVVMDATGTNLLQVDVPLNFFNELGRVFDG